MKRVQTTLGAAIIAGAILTVPGVSSATQAQPVPQWPTNQSLQTLGDSYSTATGTDTPLDSCGRVQHDMASQIVAGALPGNLPRGGGNLACNGATTDTVMQQQLNVPFHNLASAKLVTLTIGGNDANVLGFGQQCIVSDCAPLLGPELVAITTTLPNKLTALYTRLAAKVGPNTQVLVLGYPDVISQTGNTDPLCGTLSSAERAAAHQIAVVLDGVIRAKVAAFAEHDPRFLYVDPLNPGTPDEPGSPFVGHGLCSDHPYFQGATGAAPLHPNATGVSAYAQLVLQWFTQFQQVPCTVTAC